MNSCMANVLAYLFGGNNSVNVFFQITDKSWNNLTNNIVNPNSCSNMANSADYGVNVLGFKVGLGECFYD